MRHLYGITNCSTVKKARAWLEARQIDYVFHDFKKEALTAEWLAACLQHVPLEILLNKRGTTWRKLTPEEQAQAADESGAIALMCAYPSLIKRPILTDGNGVLAGFDEAQYAQYVQAAG
ncbi:putative reductase [Kingella denitrificans]|nr:ArsC family reductase [Kingella denitrificans]QQB41359.1 ArsC family reductase [Kingella denitrificans]STR12815.1 putative reductase [Kingella denitrificans]